MTVRSFVIGSCVTTIMAWAIWVAIIMLLDPTKAGLLGYILFFLTIFLAVASTSGLIGYIFRRLITPHQLTAYAVRTSLRQGLLLGLFLDILLFLQLSKLYQWWLIVIAIILFLVIELVFLSLDRAVTGRSKKTYE